MRIRNYELGIRNGFKRWERACHAISSSLSLKSEKSRGKHAPILFLLLFLASPLSSLTANTADVLVIVGAAGEAKYEEGFKSAAETWETLSERANADISVIGLGKSETTDKEQIQLWISEHADKSSLPTWIVFLGHGTANTVETKLNLSGPDLTLSDFKNWLSAVQRPLVIIHGGSASGSFITELSAKNRTIITATKSGQEKNYARFGEAFTQALASESGDLDQDGQVSLLEAFVRASETVETFYLEAGRLTSEHALIDDNGDGVGLPADSFHGLRVKAETEGTKKHDGFHSRNVALVPSQTSPNLTSEQLELRARLEQELNELIQRKSSLSVENYYNELEGILLKLAKLYVPSEED